MVSDVTEHDHCRFCGDAIPADQAYCSEECYHKDHERMRKERNTEIAWTAATAIAVVTILAIGFLF